MNVHSLEIQHYSIICTLGLWFTDITSLTVTSSNLMSIACLFVLMIGLESYAFQPHQSISRTKSHIISSSFNHDADATTANKIFFDIAIQSPTEEIELGRLTFHLTPPNHPHYLPLHISNFISLASSQRKSIDSKATYEGCLFQYSPSTIEDGSMRYKWGHVCEGMYDVSFCI